MNVSDVLKKKGHEVETSPGEATVTAALGQLRAKGIGALVVCAPGRKVVGVLSEQDIVRGLDKHGVRLLDMTVADLMSRRPPVCAPGDGIALVMARMTVTRTRHLPVLDGDRLCGLISIGDVVKHRLEEMELQTNVLRDLYIAGQ